MITATLTRLRSGGAVLDTGSGLVFYEDWRVALTEAEAQGFRRPNLIDPRAACLVLAERPTT